MLGDVHEPLLVKPARAEITLHQIITHRRPSSPVTTFAFRNDRLDASYLAQTPDPPLTDVVAEIVKIIGEDTVAALGVLLV